MHPAIYAGDGPLAPRPGGAVGQAICRIGNHLRQDKSESHHTATYDDDAKTHDGIPRQAVAEHSPELPDRIIGKQKPA